MKPKYPDLRPLLSNVALRNLSFKSSYANQHGSQDEYRKIIKVYFDSLLLMLDGRSKSFIVKWLEKHINFLDEFWHLKLVRNADEVKLDLKKLQSELDAIELLLNSRNEYIHYPRFNGEVDISESLKEAFKDIQDLKNKILSYYEYIVHFKGPRVNLIQGCIAHNLFKSFDSVLKSSTSFNIPSIFEGCFISTKVSTQSSKVSTIKMTMLGLNAMGYKITQRQTHELLKNYKNLDQKYKTDRFIKDCAYYLRFHEYHF